MLEFHRSSPFHFLKNKRLGQNLKLFKKRSVGAMIIALCIETALSLEFVDIFYTDFWQFSMNFPICFLLFLLFFCNSMSCSGCSVLYGANAVLYLRLIQTCLSS